MSIVVNSTTNEIEACHCLGKKKKNVIVRVIDRKHCLKALRNKKKLKSIDKNVIGIPNTKLFISENLTPANSKLAFNCRKLKRDGEIEKCYTINGIVDIVKNNKLITLYHLSSGTLPRGSSLIYKTSARHKRHECDRSDTNATLTHECNTSETRVQHECDTSATRVLHERHECDTSQKF